MFGPIENRVSRKQGQFRNIIKLQVNKLHRDNNFGFLICLQLPLRYDGVEKYKSQNNAQPLQLQAQLVVAML